MDRTFHYKARDEEGVVSEGTRLLYFCGRACGREKGSNN